jgi:hypothetical protein
LEEIVSPLAWAFVSVAFQVAAEIAFIFTNRQLWWQHSDGERQKKSE